MTPFHTLFSQRLVITFAVVLLSSPTLAEKPDKFHGDKHQKTPHQEKAHDKKGDSRSGDDQAYLHQQHQQYRYAGERYFDEHHHTIIRDYYDNEFRAGHCPPGLAKKHNGCLPPGQVKRWTLGRPLPRDLIYYDLPDAVIRQIGYPPAGYRFVRVASDILMIAIGTGLIVDAIADLSVLH